MIFPCHDDICLQVEVVYTCTGIGDTVIRWSVPNLMGGTEQLRIHQHMLNHISGPFTAQFVSYQNNNIISTLSFTATTVLHNKDIVCDTGGSSKTCNIMIISKIFIKILYRLLLLLYTIGEPTSPLNLSVIATTPHTVVVTWTSPVTGSQCIDHYIVTVFNETHNTMTSVNTTNNITSLTIYGLVKGNNYSFTVKGIDHADRTGSSSQSIYLVFDGKEILYYVNILHTIAMLYSSRTSC